MSLIQKHAPIMPTMKLFPPEFTPEKIAKVKPSSASISHVVLSDWQLQGIINKLDRLSLLTAAEIQLISANQFNMGVSKNRGTPKSSILIGFSIINHPFWDTIIFGNTQIFKPIFHEISCTVPRPSYPGCLPSFPRDPGSPNLRMVSWNLNTMRFEGDWTPQSSSENMTIDA